MHSTCMVSSECMQQYQASMPPECFNVTSPVAPYGFDTIYGVLENASLFQSRPGKSIQRHRRNSIINLRHITHCILSEVRYKQKCELHECERFSYVNLIYELIRQ